MEAGALLRRARVTAGLSQSALADRSGTSQTAVSAYESGKKQPSVATLSRMLAAAGSRLTLESIDQPVGHPSKAELARRGRDLVDVLGLADALPSRYDPELRFPRLRPHSSE